MQKKKLLVMSSLLVAIVLLGIGTIAYFRRTVNGDITGQAGNLVLIVNEADAVLNETFSVILQRSETENFIMPDDRGTFDLNIDSTGSSDDVEVTITISRTNLPDNLRFYLDSDYSEELTMKTYIIEKSDDMTKTVPVYWFWNGSVDDEDDSNFINTAINASISVTAKVPKTLYETLMSFEKIVDTYVDFSLESSETNGEGLMLMSSTQNDEYPIVYYRGNVATNNVIYGNYCWLIVRTTETGGTKLIYNGKVNEDGGCNNYSGVTVDGSFVSSIATMPSGSGAFIQTSAFNENNASPVYVGYMYNDTNLYFADDALNTSGYATHLSNNTVDSETGRHVQNLKDSVVKGVVDAWYEINIKGKPEENLLEDTVWCNDRSVISETYSIENYTTNDMFMYGAGTRIIEPMEDDSLIVSPSLICNRDMDKFTVDSANGNGDLDYPIGLLTADEGVLAGNVDVDDVNLVTTYLTIPTQYFWSLSPSIFNSGSASVCNVRYVGLDTKRVDATGGGARPSVSLVHETYVTGGNGSFASPYQIS